MSNKHVFSEQEVAEILRNAIAIEEQGLVAHDYTPGVTIEELQRVAEEIGISPRALEMALNATGSPEHQKKRAISFKESFERVIQGEIDPNDFDIITGLLKLTQTNSAAAATQVGRTLTAHTWTGTGTANVRVSSRLGRTKVEVTSSPLTAIMGALYPATLFGIFGGVGIGTVNPIAGALTALTLIGSGFWGFRALLNSNHRKSEELADRIEQTIQSHLQELAQASEVRPVAVSQTVEEPPVQIHEQS